MKNFNKSNTLLVLLLGSIFTYGQKPFLDSAYVQIGEKMELNLSIYEYEDLIENVDKDLKNLKSILEANTDILEKGNYAINYTPDEVLSIEQITAGKEIIWTEGGHVQYQYANQCNINSENYHLLVHFNELDNLLSDSLLIKLKEVIDTTNHIQGRYSTAYNYSFEGKNMIHNKDLDMNIGETDLIALSGGVGLNLIKNHPVIDIAAEVAIMLNKKGIMKNQYYVSYNLMFDFADSAKVNTNGFINVGYKHNLSKTKGKRNWLGVELGYLASRNGGLFKENTFKFGVNWEVGKYISVSPQLFMSGDFTEFYPALRIGFGF